MLPVIEPGRLFGRLRVLARVPDGRWRCVCQRCGNDGTVVSGLALLRGRTVQCWNCVQDVKK
jgi:hypothetical protein